MDSVLIYQIKTTAAVHKDSGEMVSVNYWVEHQGSQSFMLDTSRMIPVIKSDRAGRPRDVFGGDGLYIVYISKCAFAPSLRYMSCVNHIHYFDIWWEFFLSPSVWLARLIFVFTWRLPSFVFGV